VRRLINVELLTDNRLTPGEVQEQVTSIPLARLGRRGLDPEEVRAFCARLEHELLLRDTEAAAMQQYIQKLRMRVIQGPGEDTPAAAFQPGQVTADRIVAEAQAYSAETTQDARRHKARSSQMRERPPH
jgi:cell division septum initiation protein DivIVA